MKLEIHQYGKRVHIHCGNYRKRLTDFVLRQAQLKAEKLFREGKMERDYYEVILFDGYMELDSMTLKIPDDLKRLKV